MHVHHHHLTPGQRRWRRFRRTVVTLVAMTLIVAAVGVGGLALAMPWLVAHPDRVQAYLSDKLGRPVKFAHVEAHFQRSGPVFMLGDVEIDDPAGRAEPFKIARAELAVNVYFWLERYGSFTEFVLDGLDIDATYGADGHWRVERFASNARGDQSALLDLVAVSLRDSRLTLHHEQRGETLTLARVDLRIVNTRDGRHFGGLLRTVAGGAPLSVACATSTDYARGRCYVGGKALEVSQWLRQIPLIGLDARSGLLDLGFWADWSHGPAAVRIEAQAHEWVLRGLVPVPIGKGEFIEPRAHIVDLGLAARWQREKDGWRLDAKGWRGSEQDDASATTIALAARDEGQTRRYALDAPRVALGDWLPVLAVSRGLPDGIRGWMFQAAPRGQLLGLAARWTSDGSMDADAQLSGLAFGAARLAPGVEALDGRLIADERAMLLIAQPEQAIRIDFPHVFRAPLEFRLHSATLAALRDDEGGVRFEATDLDLAGDGVTAYGRAGWEAPESGASPVLDATIALGEGKVTAGRLFWPVNVMPPKTVAFLDRSLAGGDIAGGNVVFHGPLEDFPFRAHTGRFDARAAVRDVDFDFSTEWPRARIESAQLAFVDNTMDILADSSSMLGNAAGPAHARIENLKEPDLELDVHGSGSGADMIGLIRASPIKSKVGEFIDGLTLGGKGEVAFKLMMPLGEHAAAAPPPTLTGTVNLIDATISNPLWGVSFANATGELRFSDRGLAASRVDLTWNDLPGSIAFESGEFVGDPRHDVEVRLAGYWPVAQIFGGVPVLTPHLSRIVGHSAWELALAVDAPSASGERGKHLTITSDLRGTRLDLPEPLAKPAEAPLPFEVALDYPMVGSPIDLKLGDVIQLRGRLPSTTLPFAGVLMFGPGDIGPSPDIGLRVRGTTPSLDLGAWAALGGGGAGDGTIAEVDVGVGALKLSARDFGETHINLVPQGDETRLKLEGKNLTGEVEWSAANLAQRGVSARFEKLAIPAAPPDTTGLKTDPSKLPPLHLWAKDFRIGSAVLGETRLESYPHGDGMHIEHFETHSENLELRAQGDWTLTDGQEKSAFDISFTAPDLGKLLDALGFSGMVADGPTFAHINGWWDGAPGDVSMAKINGSLEGKVGKGRILEVDPGAGRFFGLINLQAIPRRLSLDFSDFFKTGMSFDSIEGKFTLTDGDAHTTDLVLSAPSAQVKISGRTGLAKRDYDQELDVQPKVSGVLPWVGALAGGPAGAAAGLVVQNMLSRPIKSASRARYHVTGTWENPEITLIAREKDRAALNKPAAEKAR